MSLRIYDSDGIKKWDAFTILNEPVTSIDLMERAATKACKHILTTNLFNSAALFCGTGNNGGDGLVIARLLHERGLKVTVFVVEVSKKYSPDFAANLKRLPKKIKPQILDKNHTKFETSAELIIDAVFGSGLNKPISGWIGDIIDQMNSLSSRIVSVDIPSGLFCTDNRSNDLAHVIRADQTITFQAPKMPFFYSRFSEYVGEFKITDIGLSEDFQLKPFANFITRQDIHFKIRHTFSHKGTNGLLLVISGFQNYAGAAVITSKAALRTGCGYVATHCAEASRSILLARVPECLYVDLLHDSYPEKTKAIAIGPGLGTDEYALNLLTKTLNQKFPLIIDADAINLLASNRTLLKKIPANTILTPHLTELERLIGKSSSPEELLEMQVAFSITHKVFLIQKGAYSKITTPQGEIFVNSSGNPGMGSAGMGDALTGIIGSLLAQSYNPKDAAVFGTFLHGYAADLVKRENGETGMIASDIIDHLPIAIASL